MMGPFLLPFLGIELNVAHGNDIPNIARIIIHIPHVLKYIFTHMFFLFSKYLQVPKSDFQLGEENLQNGAPPTHAAGASKKSFPHIKMFVKFLWT